MGIRSGLHGEQVAELVRCRREREQAQAAVERVRALHVGTHFCHECSHGDITGLVRLPCPTIRALDALPTTTDEEGR